MGGEVSFYYLIIKKAKFTDIKSLKVAQVLKQ